MVIGIIIGLVLIALAVAAFIGCYFCYDNGNGVGAGLLGTVGALLVLAIVIVPFSFHTIETGERAVVKNMGKITHTRDAGTNFDLWFINKYEFYDLKEQKVDIETSAYSSDAQTMELSMSFQYQIVPEKVIEIATQYGSLEVLESRIQSIVIEKTKAVLSSYKAMDIIAGIAFLVYLVFEWLEKANKVKSADLVSSIAIVVVCICEAISYWNRKRAFSYVAIAGATLILVALVLLCL